MTLSDKGRLECSYLGTDPALFIPPVPESRELNYADMDREMAQLQKRIKQSSHKAGMNLVFEDAILHLSSFVK